MSETIRVISIIGRFLEHSRAFYFLNGGAEEVYIGSADWMPRNLDRRIEAVAPIEDPAHRQTLRDLLMLMWKDNRQAWELEADGTYRQRHPPTRRPSGRRTGADGDGGRASGRAEVTSVAPCPRRFGELLHQLLLLRRSAPRAR